MSTKIGYMNSFEHNQTGAVPRKKQKTLTIIKQRTELGLAGVAVYDIRPGRWIEPIS